MKNECLKIDLNIMLFSGAYNGNNQKMATIDIDLIRLGGLLGLYVDLY